jgi:hypothetical protein
MDAAVPGQTPNFFSYLSSDINVMDDASTGTACIAFGFCPKRRPAGLSAKKSPPIGGLFTS